MDLERARTRLLFWAKVVLFGLLFGSGWGAGYYWHAARHECPSVPRKNCADGSKGLVPTWSYVTWV